jgi:hypothetical protein
MENKPQSPANQLLVIVAGVVIGGVLLFCGWLWFSSVQAENAKQDAIGQYWHDFRMEDAKRQARDAP